MISLDEAIYEVGDRTNAVRFEVEQNRLARLAASSQSGNGVPALRRVIVLAGDYAAGLLCLLRRRFAASPASLAC